MNIKGDIHQAIASLRRLRFDWDGNGGLPIRDDVYRLACGGLFTLHPLDGLNWSLINRAGMPAVTLLGDGTVALAWGGTTRRLTLRITPCDTVCYVKEIGRHPTGTEDGVAQVGCLDYDAAEALIRWYVTGREEP